MSQENHLSRISIVIPSVVSDLGRISSIVRLNSMDLFHQIIIVVSGIDSESEESLSHYFPLNNTGSNLSFVCVKDVLHPGQARNLGVKSVKTEYVSFLDARTSPSNLWFEFLSNFVKTNQQGLQLSSVQYIPTSSSQRYLLLLLLASCLCHVYQVLLSLLKLLQELEALFPFVLVKIQSGFRVHA